MVQISHNIFASAFWGWLNPIIGRNQFGEILFVNQAFLTHYGGQIKTWQNQPISNWPLPHKETPLLFSDLPQFEGQTTQSLPFEWVESYINNDFFLAISHIGTMETKTIVSAQDKKQNEQKKANESAYNTSKDSDPFFFTEKASQQELSELNIKSTARQTKSIESLCVLIGNNDALGGLAMQAILETIGVQVTLVESGTNILEAIQNAVHEGMTYDIIFLDLTMPQMDGFSTTHVIRDLGGTYQDAIIVGIDFEITKEKNALCLEIGMNGTIEKPCPSHAITRFIHLALER